VNSITHLVELADLKLHYNDVITCGMAGFHISPQSWETLAAHCNGWRASLSAVYSLSATNYVEKNGEAPAQHR